MAYLVASEMPADELGITPAPRVLPYIDQVFDHTTGLDLKGSSRFERARLIHEVV